MTARSARAALALAGGLVVLAPTAAWAAGARRPAVPAEYTDPTPREVAKSIHVWDPSGNVKAMETTSADGDQTVLRLDSDILFAFGSAELSATAAARIQALVADIPAGVAVTVTGHTDAIGSDADNLALSQRRAEAVAVAMRATRGDLQLTVSGRGEAEPVKPNTDAAGREANRRVEIRHQG